MAETGFSRRADLLAARQRLAIAEGRLLQAGLRPNPTLESEFGTPRFLAGEAESDMHGMGGMQSSPGAAQAPYDLQFIDTMTAHHQGAIDMARMAETKAQHAEPKTFARRIIEDQQREIGQMKSWRGSWYAGRPQAMNMEMPGMMDSMQGMDINRMQAATGNDFDLMFLDMMTPHHAGATEMAREALRRAEHPEIKRLAQQIIDAQEKEIAQMNKWKAAWGNQS